MIAALSAAENEAVLFLAEYETVKVAADRRCVSEHTQHNQIRAAMEKLDVHTQIGLIKEFFRLMYGVRYSLSDATRRTATALLLVFMVGMGNIDQIVRRRCRMRRTEIECIIE